MNRKALFAGAIFLTVAVTIIILHNGTALGTPPESRQIAQANTDAAAPPKQEAQPVEVKLAGITTISNHKKALLRVDPPAGTSGRGKSYILSEGQSIEGLTVESINTTNATVTVRIGQVRRTLRLEKGSQS
jgi:hypothetical protein